MANSHAIPNKPFTGLPDYGGEGYKVVSNQKTDMKLVQLGGEGSKDLGKKSDMTLYKSGDQP